MQHLHESYPNLKVLLVNSGESIDIARPYYQRSMATITIALDEEGQVDSLYHVYAYPTLVFVDHLGIVRQIYVGAPRNQTLQEGLKAIGIQ